MKIELVTEGPCISILLDIPDGWYVVRDKKIYKLNMSSKDFFPDANVVEIFSPENGESKNELQ